MAPPPAAAKNGGGTWHKRRKVQKMQDSRAGFVNEDRNAYRNVHGPDSLVTGNVRLSSDPALLCTRP